MQKNITIKVTPETEADAARLRRTIVSSCGVVDALLQGYTILRRSIDARGRQPWIQLQLLVYIEEPALPRPRKVFDFKQVRAEQPPVIIVGAGPAGLFAALQLLEMGLRPLLLERGKDVRARRRDLAAMNKEGRVNAESNYCFGEGGAGTYSDGKLYTRSHKRGDVERILELFVHFGADEKILYEAHPHIGTNKLPGIISAMRQQIIDCGGSVLFEHKVIDFILEDDRMKGVITVDGTRYEGLGVILATGHSARDIFLLLAARGIRIEAKPFALGVRAEHPQSCIDTAQYKMPQRNPLLPPASYSLVQQVEGVGVFSFCMCPGGIIAPAATAAGEIVVNGWSPSKRNNPYANSGIVVQVDQARVLPWLRQQGQNAESDALVLLRFQQAVERAAFLAGGGNLQAPAQRMVDFCDGKISADLPGCSYLPGISPADLGEVLPPFIYRSLQEGFRAFGKKMRGYFTNEAVLVATESRTSSPVRIPRDPDTLQHPQYKGLYPCAEGAGYAGGIVSAAMDGERVARAIAGKLGREAIT
ncbi:FAD-binding protein [Niabella terrae]